MRFIKVVGLLVLLGLSSSSIVLASERVTENSEDTVFEQSGEGSVFGDASSIVSEEDDEEALFGDDRGVMEAYIDYVDVSSTKAEIDFDLVKIPIKNNYDKPIKFAVWGEVIGVDGLPYSGAVGETFEAIKPGEKGYIEVKYSYYKDCTMTLVDYQLKEEEGNYLATIDRYGINEFEEPIVIEIKAEEIKKAKEGKDEKK